MQQCPVVSDYARKKPLPVRRQRGGQRSQLFIIALNLSRLPELASEFPVQSSVVSDGKAMICSRCINSGKIISFHSSNRPDGEAPGCSETVVSLQY